MLPASFILLAATFFPCLVFGQLNALVASHMKQSNSFYFFDDKLQLWLDPNDIPQKSDRSPVGQLPNKLDATKPAELKTNGVTTAIIVNRNETMFKPLVAFDPLAEQHAVLPTSDTLYSDFSQGFTITFVYYTLGRSNDETFFGT